MNVSTGSRRELALLLLALAALTLWRALAVQSSDLTLNVDEAQYWSWAQSLDWGYYSKPPMIAAVIAATTAVCGDGVACIKSGALLIYPLTALIIFALARRLADNRTAFWSALLFITFPGVAFSSQLISTDVPLFLCWATALYGYVRALEDDRWRWWLLTGLACGLGLLTKYTMGIFVLSAAVHCAVTPELRRQFFNPHAWAGAVLALAVFAPNLWWNAQNDWITLEHTGDIAKNASPRRLAELSEFLGGQALLIGPVLFFALLWLMSSRGWRQDPHQRLLACFTLPFLALISLQALIGRANANWGAMTYVAGTVWLVLALLPARRSVLVAAFVSNLLLAVLPLHFHALANAAGITLNQRTDIYKRMQGWDVAGCEVRARLQQNPGTVLLIEDRDAAAQFGYYARPESKDLAMWNPRDERTSHYHLSTTMQGNQGRDLIWVSRRAPGEDVSPCFSAAQALEPIRVAIRKDYVLDYFVWRLDGFKGYAACKT